MEPILRCESLSKTYPSGGRDLTVEAVEPKLQSAPVVAQAVYSPSGTYPTGMIPAGASEEPTKE